MCRCKGVKFFFLELCIMLYVVDSIDSKWVKYISSDPVRPTISVEDRINSNSVVYIYSSSGIEADAVLCVKFLSSVPASEYELLSTSSGSVVIFYSIWSNRSGSGKELLKVVYSMLKGFGYKDFVTLSPCSELARKFHISNGASILRINDSSINYLYS